MLHASRPRSPQMFGAVMGSAKLSSQNKFRAVRCQATNLAPKFISEAFEKRRVGLLAVSIDFHGARPPRANSRPGSCGTNLVTRTASQNVAAILHQRIESCASAFLATHFLTGGAHMAERNELTDSCGRINLPPEQTAKPADVRCSDGFALGSFGCRIWNGKNLTHRVEVLSCNDPLILCDS